LTAMSWRKENRKNEIMKKGTSDMAPFYVIQESHPLYLSNFVNFSCFEQFCSATCDFSHTHTHTHTHTTKADVLISRKKCDFYCIIHVHFNFLSGNLFWST
jgi:hypothetical protein